VNVAVTVMGFVYVGCLARSRAALSYQNGVGLILGVVLCVAYDIVGYVVGSQFGKTASPDDLAQQDGGRSSRDGGVDRRRARDREPDHPWNELTGRPASASWSRSPPRSAISASRC
jgi:hypothetical protein